MQKAARFIGAFIIFLAAIVGAYAAVLWLQQSGGFPPGTDTGGLSILEKDFAPFIGAFVIFLATLVAAAFAMLGAHTMQKAARFIRDFIIFLVALVGAYAAVYLLQQSGVFGTDADGLNIFEKDFAIVGGLATLVAAAFAILGGHTWMRRFYEGHKLAQDYQKNRAYADLDEFYIRLLSIAIEKPYLRNPYPVPPNSKNLDTPYKAYPAGPPLALTGHPVEHYELQYEAYAFMIWNFLETIHDRCEEHPDLLDTWAPIVSAENEIHRGWFLQQMRDQAEKAAVADDPKRHVRSDKFCHGFQVFIFDRNFRKSNRHATQPSAQYHYWPYKHVVGFFGKEEDRPFKKPQPTAFINGTRVLVWPPEQKAPSSPATTSVPATGVPVMN